MRAPLAGRVVGGPHEVTPNDVPMDGSAAFFPLSDGTAVIAKAWRPDGTIGTVRYVPEVSEDEGAEDATTVSLMDVMDRLDSMEDLIRGSQPKKAPSRARTAKGGDDA